MGEASNLSSGFRVDNIIFNCGELNNLEQELINKRDNYNTYIKELNIDNNKFIFLQTREYELVWQIFINGWEITVECR